jgi:hypothetical protein
MATAQEQQLAKDIVVAWLHTCTNASVSHLQDPDKAGNLIANVYKTIVKAINETSTRAEGVDATG